MYIFFFLIGISIIKKKKKKILFLLFCQTQHKRFSFRNFFLNTAYLTSVIIHILFFAQLVLLLSIFFIEGYDYCERL